MQRRGVIAFVVLNILVTVGVVFLLLSVFGGGESEPTERLVTFQVVITATTDPNVTPNVTVVTGTPPEGREIIPDDVREETSVAQAPTIDPEAFDEEGNFTGDSDALPEGCIEHTLADGEFPSLVAETYGANFFELMTVNGLDEESAVALQIGDVLIVPLEGCPIEQLVNTTTEVTAEATPEITPEITAEITEEATEEAASVTPTVTQTPTITPTPTETPIPTVTLAPTAQNAQIEILEVRGAGDITQEAVVIRNNGNTIDIGGWTLSDADGNTYVIPSDRRLFSEGVITIVTRAPGEGEEDTAILLYWGRDEAVFGESETGGEVIVLANREGEAQASLRLPAVNDGS